MSTTDSTQSKPKTFAIYRYSLIPRRDPNMFGPQHHTGEVLQPSVLTKVLRQEDIQLEGDGKDVKRFPKFHQVCRGDIWVGEPLKLHPLKVQKSDYTQSLDDNYPSGWVIIDARHGLIAIERCPAFDYKTDPTARLLFSTLHKRLDPDNLTIELSVPHEKGSYLQKIHHLVNDRGARIKSIRFDTHHLMGRKDIPDNLGNYLSILSELSATNAEPFAGLMEHDEGGLRLDDGHLSPTAEKLLKYCERHGSGVTISLSEGYGDMKPQDMLWLTEKLSEEVVSTFAHDGDLHHMPHQDEPGRLLVTWLDNLNQTSKSLDDIPLKQAR